jgi:queuine tRNA-ribosyltransferase
MTQQFSFEIEKRLENELGRAGKIHTLHGDILTPAFITVGTKATVKALSVEQVKETGAQAVLANTYHLYLEPGDSIVERAGGLGRFMNWDGPTCTDSGGFQVFSLGSAFGKGVTKVATDENFLDSGKEDGRVSEHGKLAKVDDDGVTFRSYIDGSEHRFTPERSIEIQHNIGADIIVAFDECTSPIDTREYQEIALKRTHNWAKRSLSHHKQLGGDQALYGVIQGGAYEDLRTHAAETVGALDFDGFGIGGSFTKSDIGTAVHWVNKLLPEAKPDLVNDPPIPNPSRSGALRSHPRWCI